MIHECPECLGQQVIYEASAAGEGYVPHRCARCLGTGIWASWPVMPAPVEDPA